MGNNPIELKNILITFVAAKQVIDGELTLGMMMAITYIIGQLNGPIEQFLRFAQTAQDAKLGLRRLGEIHSLQDEERDGAGQRMAAPPQSDIHLHHVSFAYSAYDKRPVLQDVTLTIPFQKVTAIVGASGSGKTTLMKLILKFYQPLDGAIAIGEADLAHCSATAWRQRCGVVMQDGYLFNDTIARNIALSDLAVDDERLFHAARVANLQDDIARLPNHYLTQIGADGHGLSQGQKQRVLIARAVYKNPDYLFFDEATSSLDAKNERVIQQNLQDVLQGKTVLVIAHRLGTVKHADQIIVLDAGRVVETGTHDDLSKQRGYYFNLIKNQLELGG